MDDEDHGGRACPTLVLRGQDEEDADQREEKNDAGRARCRFLLVGHRVPRVAHAGGQQVGRDLFQRV